MQCSEQGRKAISKSSPGSFTLESVTQEFRLFSSLSPQYCPVHCTLYSVQYNMCTEIYMVYCTVHDVQCTVYSVQCTGYSVQYTVQCTVYSVQCTVYTVECNGVECPSPNWPKSSPPDLGPKPFKAKLLAPKTPLSLARRSISVQPASAQCNSGVHCSLMHCTPPQYSSV